jgi:hypothetical protein
LFGDFLFEGSPVRCGFAVKDGLNSAFGDEYAVESGFVLRFGVAQEAG